jgi:hypothetical protein
MTFFSRSSSESVVAGLCISLGVGVAIYLSPKDEYFAGNFAYFWLPHAVILAVLVLIRARFASVAACAFVMTAYLVAFDTWVSTLSPRDGLAWVGYLFALPGAAVGAIVSVLVLARVPVRNVLRGAGSISIVTALLTVAGLSANQAVLCATVMHCALR